MIPQKQAASNSEAELLCVVGLVRVSTQGQAAGLGLERQYSSIHRTVERKRLRLLKVFEVIDVSGTEVLRSPQIQELLRMVENREVQGICIDSLDRLFRPDKPSDYAILGVFQSSGAILYCGDMELDLTTGAGMLFGQIRASIAGFELSVMKARVEGSKQERRVRGKCPTNELTMPMGTLFDRTQDKWVYTKDIARVQELYRLFDSEGITNYCELARRTGIQRATAKILLGNPIYTGWRVINQRRGEKRVSRTGKLYRVKVARAEEEIIRVKVFDEPAVPQEVHDRVQIRMAKIRFNHNQRFRDSAQINLGAGVLFCGYCGEPFFYTSAKPGGHGYTTCKANHNLYKKKLGGCKQRNLRKDEIDSALVLLATQVVRNPENLVQMIMASLERQRAIILPLPGLGDSSVLTSDLDRRDRRLLKAYEEGVIEIETLRSRRAAIRNQREKLTENKARGDDKKTASILETARLIVKSGIHFDRITDPADRKAALGALFERVVVRDCAITGFGLHHAILPTGSPVLQQIVHLESPILIGVVEEKLAEGFKRCTECQEVKSAPDGFYRYRKVCRTCLSVEAAEAYQRRRRQKLEKVSARGGLK